MRALLLAAALACLAPAARAQEEGAALVADALVLTPGGLLVAEGNVQAFYGGATLSAPRVTYDPEADRLSIEGPVLLRDPEGNVLSAERAELDPRLEQGLLAGARLVLDRQLQIAAATLRQGEGTATLEGAAATSCQVCPGRAPLWEIRAARVMRDEAAQTLTFEDAQFLVRGAPILWLPRIRLPEPGNARETGLVLPRLRGSDELGLGIEVPYFLELGPSRDLTLTPFLAPATVTLGARYREAFLNGTLEARGALSRDGLRPGETRGFLAAEGAFALPGDFDLAFAGIVATDADYLSDYGLADGDAAESRLRIARVGPTSLIEGGVSAFQDLGEDEAPEALGDLGWERRTPLAGGTLTFGASLDAVLREEGAPGREGLRAGAFAGWRADRVVGPGLLVEGEGRLAADAWRLSDGAGEPESFLRAAPAAAVTLRWPLVRRGSNGTADLLEPVASLGWSGAWGETPPAEGSRRSELDEASLLAFPRRPGEEGTEEGARGALGLAWTRQAGGSAATLTLGRVFGQEEEDAWLVAAGLDLPERLSLRSRATLGEEWDLTSAEALVAWESAALSLSGGWAFLEDLGGERAADVVLDAEFRPSERWTLRTEARYDLDAGAPRELGLGLGWRNECVEVDVSVERSYTLSGDGKPATTFGLSVGLLGFSTTGGARVAPGACRG